MTTETRDPDTITWAEIEDLAQILADAAGMPLVTTELRGIAQQAMRIGRIRIDG